MNLLYSVTFFNDQHISFRAGAASNYGSSSTKMMQLLLAPAPQHWYLQMMKL
jgi:hypothetical protein